MCRGPVRRRTMWRAMRRRALPMRCRRGRLRPLWLQLLGLLRTVLVISCHRLDLGLLTELLRERLFGRSLLLFRLVPFRLH
jgi:hypothetical protein